MLDRTLPPPINPLQICAIHAPECHTLSNGIKLKIFKNHQLDLIHLSISIRAGALFEPKKRLATFCYNLLQESHPSKSAEEIDDFLDFYGTSIQVTCRLNFISINFMIPKKNCATILPVITEMLCTPVFRKENLERYREKQIQNFTYHSRKTNYWSIQMMYHHYFSTLCPFGKLIDTNDFNAITLADLQNFHHTTWRAENIRIFIAGNVEDDLISTIDHLFKKIPSGNGPFIFNKKIDTVPPTLIHKKQKDAQQTSLLLCRPMFAYSHEDAHPFSFLNTLFCNYFGSRLMQNLREKNGYTYGISGNQFFFDSGSIFYIDSEINNDKVEDAIQECMNEMTILHTQLVDNNEMDRVRNYILGQTLRSMDGTVSQMVQYIGWDDFGANENRMKQFIHTIHTITAEDIRNLAQKYFSTHDWTTIIVGN